MELTISIKFMMHIRRLLFKVNFSISQGFDKTLSFSREFLAILMFRVKLLFLTRKVECHAKSN